MMISSCALGGLHSTQKPFGIGTQNLHERQVQIGREWRRIDIAELAVGQPGIALTIDTEALGKVDLIAIAIADVLLNALQGVGVLRIGEAGFHLSQCAEGYTKLRFFSAIR